MSEKIMVPKRSRLTYEIETTKGTAVADTAASSFKGVLDGAAERGLSDVVVERQYMAGHVGRYRSLQGGRSDDLGFDISYHAKASGTHGVAPEVGKMLRTTGWLESVGVAGTVDASPTPTTVSATLTGATIAAGHLADIEVTSGVFETRRILTESSGAVTWWPPTSVAPSSGNTVNPGVAYTVTSDNDLIPAGTGRFYHENGEIDTFVGCNGNLVMALTINQPMMMNFAMNALDFPLPDQATIGFTWSPPDFLIVPEVVFGMYLRLYIPAEVDSGATTTSIPLRYTDATASKYEVKATMDKLIVDVAGNYETQLITAWDYATQTATTAAFSGSPAEDQSAYIERIICVEDTINIDLGHDFQRNNCQSSSTGWDGQTLVNRATTIDWNRYFKSHEDLRLLRQADFVDFWSVLGSNTGNKVKVNIPNVFRETYDLDLGGDRGLYVVGGGGYTNSVAGDDEIFITFG